MAEKPLYMDVNTFLEKFGKMIGNQDMNNDAAKLRHIASSGPVASRMNDGILYPENNIDAFVSEGEELSSDEAKEIFVQVCGALVDTGQEAQKFLRMFRMFTVLERDSNAETTEFREAEKTLLYMVNEGKIKDPSITYLLLVHVRNKQRNPITELCRTIALSEYATPYDVIQYALSVKKDDTKAPDELMDMLSDQVAKMDARIDAELHQDFPDRKIIEDMQPGLLGNLATHISNILSAQGRTEDAAKMDALNKEYYKKYQLENIFASRQPDYIRKYNQDATQTVIEQQAQIKELQATISTLQQENRNLVDDKTEKDEQHATQIEQLQKEIQKLKEDRQNFITILNMKLGAVKVDLADYDTKKDMTFGRGAALAKILEDIKTILYGKNPQQDYNLIRETELMFAKMKTAEKQGAHI